VAAKPQHVVVQKNQLVVAKHLLADAQKNQLVAAKPQLADAQKNQLADVQNQLVAVKHLHVVAVTAVAAAPDASARSVADC